MTKRHVLLLTAVLGMASAPAALAQTTAPAPTAAPTKPSVVTATPKDTKLSAAPVTVSTGSFRGPLSVLLSAVAKSAGYDLVFNFNVDALALIDGNVVSNEAAQGSYASAVGKPQELGAKPIAYSFVKQPFNEVWPLLMDVYELQYQVVQMGNGQVMRISQRPAQDSLELKNVTPQEAITRAKEFFGTEQFNKDGVSLGYAFDSKTMRIIADPATSRVMLGGTADEVSKLAAFLTELDGQARRAASVPQAQIIYTTPTKLDSLRSVLQVEYPTLKIRPVADTGQLIISGPQDQVAAAQALLGRVDPNGMSSAQVSATGTTVQKIYRVLGNQDDVTKFLATQYPGLKVTALGQTGQLVINGGENQIKSALDLLAEIDKAPTSKETVQKVFQLVNASAEEVKATLEGTLARDLNQGALVPNATLIDPSTGQPYTTGPLANAPLNSVTTASTTAATPTQASTAATIIADKRTNTVIVRGTQIQVNQVADLIPQLDKVVPQINVQVRIQEITQQATRSLGLDWAVNFGGFKVKLGSAGVGATFDPTQSLMGFNIFPTLNALETQNLAKKVYDGSITMQSGQRALTSNGLTANVSSTAAASIKSGGRLEVSIPSSAANVAAIQRQIDYGVNLDFFDPQVAPDGSITLRVRGQVNDLTTKIPDNGVGVPNILQFTNSEAQSVVTFKSGQTLLLTGLMGNKSTESNKGVPYLSSIPVIGAAFGSQTYDKSATQLLVVITGTVVQ